MTDNFKQYADFYAQNGWRIVPLHNVITTQGQVTGCTCGNVKGCESTNKKPGWGKHPRISGWQTAATTDAAKISDWFRQWPDMQIGVATGAESNLWVLDIDGVEGLASLKSLEEQNGPLPLTWTIRTGSKGLQFYFLWPEALGTRTMGNRAGILPGIDTRGTGGQVVAPPSSNRNGPYEVADESPVCAAPEWLVDLVASKPLPVAKPWTPPPTTIGNTSTETRARLFAEAAAKRVSTAPDGTRNKTLYSATRACAEVYACYNLPQMELYNLIIPAAEACGLSQGEASTTFNSGWKDGAATPKPLEDRPWRAAPPIYQLPARLDYDGPPPAELPEYEEPADLPVHLTDTGNARIMVQAHGQDIRFSNVAKGDGWHVWDGAKWIFDEKCQAEQWAKQVAETHWDKVIELEDQYPNPSKDEEKMINGYRAHAKRTECKVGIQGTLFALRSEPNIAVSADQWDADHWIMTAKNASINLKTGDIYPHKRTDYSTKQAGAAIAPSTDCPTWTKFLDEIMASATGEQRPQLVSYLQRLCGYCLTGSTKEQIFCILWGKGSNGKSTFIEVIRHVMGDYAETTRPETIMAKDRSAIPNDIAALAGARLITTAETNKGTRLNEGLVKELTGGDTISARFLNKEFFDFNPVFKLMLLTNNRPIIKGTDEGIWRRIHLIPFEAHFSKENGNIDKDLKSKLIDEADAILSWMVQGTRLWLEEGLSPPKEVTAAVDAYRKESDILAEFIEEKTKKDATSSIPKADLYRTYTAWCDTNGEHPMKQRTLTTALEERGWVEAAGRASGRSWSGHKLTEPAPSLRKSMDSDYLRGLTDIDH